jgi:hypothetical protein
VKSGKKAPPPPVVVPVNSFCGVKGLYCKFVTAQEIALFPFWVFRTPIETE